MTELFGLPINHLLVILLSVFGAGMLILGTISLRNRVIFKMALRNIPRRPTQTVLIVLGLMLATLLFSASFTTGDIMTNNMQTIALQDLGQVDAVIGKGSQGRGDRPSYADVLSPQAAYFNQSLFNQVRRMLVKDPEVEGLAPLVHEAVPVLAPGTRLSVPGADLMGLSGRWQVGFDLLKTAQGQTLSLDRLRQGQVYLSQKLAGKLDAAVGDMIQVFLGAQPSALNVAGLYTSGADPSGAYSLAMPLNYLQQLTGHPNEINTILIADRGTERAGADHAAVVLANLKPMLQANGLAGTPIKRDALDGAQDTAGMFMSMFLMFGQFSTVAGILLIFLIYIMLAAERQRELGIARAIGAQRIHVIQLFALEGAVYALLASAVGSILGVIVGWGIARFMPGAAVTPAFIFNWRSVVIAFTLGMALTFVVTLLSSFRASRLNIVRAVRGLPEPKKRGRSKKGFVLAAILTVLGAVMLFAGLQGKQMSSFMMGASLVIIGLPLIARAFGLKERIAFTMAGLGLVVWWLGLRGPVADALPAMQDGMESFFLSGIMIVLGAIWAVMYNSELLLNAIVGLLRRVKGMPSVLKTAVSYPMQNRFRTGMTLAMFSLVVFTLAMMATMVHANEGLFADAKKLASGFQIRATTSYTNPIDDLRKSLPAKGELGPSQVPAIAELASLPIEFKQAGTEGKYVSSLVQGLDAGYIDNASYKFAMTAKGYKSSREVWRALQTEPDTVVLTSLMVSAKASATVGMPSPPLKIQGVWQEDKVLPELYLEVRNSANGQPRRLRVIGVLDQTYTWYALFSQDAVSIASWIRVSRRTLDNIAGAPVPTQNYMIRIKDQTKVEATAKHLAARFLEHGMQTQVIADEIRLGGASFMMVNNLIEGFMSLGLIIGIVALGVIAARSVVERWKEIGILRALGFQKGMVQLSFLLESSFISLLGISLGLILGLSLAPQFINSAGKTMAGFTYQGIPWTRIALIGGLAYLASLLTTFIPARQASKVYPAEALRYE